MSFNGPESAQSKGGQIMAERQRKEAVECYYDDPNYCKECENIIKVKEGQKVSAIRKKEFL